jgi:quercetin dioxygenase-like cupin family protein
LDKISIQDLIQFSPEKMRKIPLFESDRMFYDLYCLEPGQEQKVHAHDGSDKVYLALEGHPTVRIGSESEVIRRGEAVLAPAGVEHGVSNPESERAVLLVVMAPKP